MDIEAAGSGWSGSAAANHAWLVQAINQAASMIGAERIGIYSSAYGWSVAMGGYADLTKFPLWYAQSVPNIIHTSGEARVIGVSTRCWDSVVPPFSTAHLPSFRLSLFCVFSLLFFVVFSYDGSASFGDYSPFGGWSRPAMKQFAGDATVCGFGVDLNCW